jgi:RHS repeat-associated protein
VYTYTSGQVTGITVNGTSVLSGVVYEPFGPVRGWTWGNSTTETRLHDTDGNPSLFTGAESTSYSLDNAFRIQGISNANTPAVSWGYGYDALDRLTSGTNSALNPTWTYDGNGNRQTQGGAAAPAYAASSLTFSYNNRGRMASATTSGTTSYIYNGLGQRIQKSGPGGTTLFAYDEAGHLLGEYSNAGSLIQETLWLGDLPVATLRPGTPVGIYYVHADHLGTPRAVTRSSDNAKVWRWDSDPFGIAPPNQNPGGLGVFAYNLRYPGQYFDGETGLSYNDARDFDRQTGRYVESDPIGLAGGNNTYAYVEGNPLSLIDVRGLCDSDPCEKLANKITKLRNELAKRAGDLRRNALNLPATGPMSIAGHQQQYLNKQKQLRDLLNEFNSKGCGGGAPPDSWGFATTPVPEPERDHRDLVQEISAATGLTGTALYIYITISEGSRVIPARNLIPIW